LCSLRNVNFEFPVEKTNRGYIRPVRSRRPWTMAMCCYKMSSFLIHQLHKKAFTLIGQEDLKWKPALVHGPSGGRGDILKSYVPTLVTKPALSSELTLLWQTAAKWADISFCVSQLQRGRDCRSFSLLKVVRTASLRLLPVMHMSVRYCHQNELRELPCALNFCLLDSIICNLYRPCSERYRLYLISCIKRNATRMQKQLKSHGITL
jgi:hypothetical protein